jgi:hypothetical protein
VSINSYSERKVHKRKFTLPAHEGLRVEITSNSGKCSN